MMEERYSEVWPFHESIVYALENPDELDIEVLFWIICHTVIPAGHDRIIVALEKALGVARDFWPQELEAARVHILDQKRLAEEKTMKKAAEVAEKLRRLDDALAAIVDDDDSATPPETAAGEEIGPDGLTEKERVKRLQQALGSIPSECRPCIN